MTSDHSSQFLDETEIEARLMQIAELREFWESPDALILIRGRPTTQDPIYEIQLAWDLGDRLETYAWVWIDAIEGHLLNRI